mmetsp:Transcript_2455/g.3948  ORF Transcript_2455/g.3948 Transcript_2455/m.3948 type:complete len:279 (-) Transcript_2455:40-876(-)|eukprot:CAMPEP_0184296662 /NCGR_PEP_ID=MMETSP1049-20130417/7619_1 /TAXON_ID=77928 /ORGANISM="Proteomonas sulcata, Strain CCMP704" /LENGTH=278 /DNA_ID=CAMNT_0026606009 /DNA_START=384 /DNA_END=1220 /DNA_ORIENTATION=-
MVNIQNGHSNHHSAGHMEGYVEDGNQNQRVIRENSGAQLLQHQAYSSQDETHATTNRPPMPYRGGSVFSKLLSCVGACCKGLPCCVGERGPGFPDAEALKSVLSLAREIPVKPKGSVPPAKVAPRNSGPTCPFGPGIFWTCVNGKAFVVGFEDGSVAKCEGLREGDVLTSIDGVDVSNYQPKAALALLMGTRQSTVNITVMRRGIIYWEPTCQKQAKEFDEDLTCKMSFTPGSKPLPGKPGNSFAEYSCCVHRQVVAGKAGKEVRKVGKVSGQEIFQA